jgi:hypothetical protein
MAPVYGVGAILYRMNTPPDHVPQHDDAPVSGSQMLQAVPGDAPVDARLRIVVARDTLPLLIGALPVLPEAGIAPQFLPLRSSPEADLHGVGIVNRHRPRGRRRTIDGGPFGHRVRIRRELVNVGRNEVGDAHPYLIPLPPCIDIYHPSGGLHEVPFTKRCQVARKPFTAGEGMEKGQMRRVHTIFLHLQPVTRPDRARAGHQLVAG